MALIPDMRPILIKIRLFFVLVLISAVGNARAGTLIRSEDNSPEILYFGSWTEDNGQHISDAFYARCYYTFRKSEVRWIGSTGSDHGFADIYINGEFQESVDTYSKKERRGQVIFEKEGLTEERIHTICIVVRREKNPHSSGSYQAVEFFESKDPVDYRSWFNEIADAELAQIAAVQKTILPAGSWNPVFNRANVPETGVRLLPGVFNNCFIRNIAYLNHCFASPTFCDGTGWSSWLPKSNDGRMLQVAANTLRWGERGDMRDVVNTIVSEAEYRQRFDGYSNYYPENESYTLSPGGGLHNSERKNYDRVFWTRGLLDAGRVGNQKAYDVVRKFYDWFNNSPYLGNLLNGSNATNGTPGGGLVYFSPVGKRDDMETTLKYLDQEYWISELRSENSLCFSYYPGDRPHCYELLTLEAFIDEYKATGDLKYFEAVKGGWHVYNDYYKHIGGITAICENRIYPPGSYYLVNTLGENLPWEEGYHNGETCGSVFWININSKLLQLFPQNEKYATEIEEGIYNTMMACQDSKGYIRYHNVMDGEKEAAKCENTCCENSVTGMIAKLPQYIYSIAEDGIYINLFASSAIKWQQDNEELSLVMKTAFPYDDHVAIDYKGPESKQMKLHIRIPSWVKKEVIIEINKEEVARGEPATYVTLERTWNNGDVIDLRIPPGLSLHKYTGLDQDREFDKYALMYGPILMAMVGDSHLNLAQGELVENLVRNYQGNLQFPVNGMQNTKYVPYFLVEDERFTCYPTFN